jgi:hypothetical protein
VTEDERDAAESDRAAAEIGRVEAEEDRVDAEAGEGGAALELGRVQAEEGRVIAEAGREERENRRRIAEGGPDNHLSDATGRVEAEEEREENLRKWLGRYATIIALAVAFVALIPSMVGLLLLHREINSRCEDAATNRVAIRQTIIDGLKSLGYQYVNGKIVEDGPPLDYYVLHPDERASQLVKTEATLRRFKEVHCGK